MGDGSTEQTGEAPPAVAPDADEPAPSNAGRRRGIDLTGALGTAGHEVELLHAEDVADTAPVIGEHRSRNDLDLDVAASWALRGMDADLFSPDEAT